MSSLNLMKTFECRKIDMQATSTLYPFYRIPFPCDNIRPGIPGNWIENFRMIIDKSSWLNLSAAVGVKDNLRLQRSSVSFHFSIEKER